MPLFKRKKCLCGLDPTQVEIKPNPLGRFFCPVCGREFIPIKPKKEALTEVEPEPGTEPEPEPEPESEPE